LLGFDKTELLYCEQVQKVITSFSPLQMQISSDAPSRMIVGR